jgi:hypothetical protein
MFGIELEGFPSDEEMKKWPKNAKKLAVDHIKLKVLGDIIGDIVKCCVWH